MNAGTECLDSKASPASPFFEFLGSKQSALVAFNFPNGLNLGRDLFFLFFRHKLRDKHSLQVSCHIGAFSGVV